VSRTDRQVALATEPGLAAFRNAHAGENIIVCGCGRSLLDLESPLHYVTIGVNDVGRLFDPTYLVVVNPRSQFKGDRFAHVQRSGARALFTQLELGRVRPPVVRFRLGKFGGTDIGAAETLHYTQNSPYVAVCLAAYMGARRIGLIGVDLTDDHFFARTGRHPLAGRVREIDAQYGRLAAALGARGVELVNLSASSRLTSLPRMHIGVDGTWTGAPEAAGVETLRPASQPGRTSMKVAIERRSTGLVGQLLEALAASASKLGHAVSRDPAASAHDPRAVSIVWNGRRHSSRGPTLYCEHGWLPRSAYQISPAGINAASHLAPFLWDGIPLTSDQDAALDTHLDAIKATSFTGYYQYMDAGKDMPGGLPPEFLLVPLQIESDTNIVRHAPAMLRTMQAFMDHIARQNPPWPVIFKQHPADVRHGSRHLRLLVRRRQDLLWPQSRGNIHQLLQSGGCRGVVTINSNVAHDCLLWNVPAVVLGRNVWPTTGPHLPFLTAIPRDWFALAESVTAAERVACRRAYAHYLMKHQWTLVDARDPEKVAMLLAGVRVGKGVHPSRSRVRVVPRPTLALPIINVVAENRGWLFEAWKRAYTASAWPGFQITASDRPLRHAAAWIFVRAKEAAATPDPRRTVVQLHDLLDPASYRPGGLRSCVANCAGVSLTHPDQQGFLEGSGLDLSLRRWLIHPVGWGTAAELSNTHNAIPSIAWIGRPATHAGVEVSRLGWFVEAASLMRGRARVVLIGERLERAIATLRRQGVDCRAESLRKYPPLRAAEWIGRFDCVVICGGADSGPWPLFDALHAGVPVVASPVGWAVSLLADGACGRLAEGPIAIAQAIGEILSERDQWRMRRTVMRERVAEFSLSKWIEQNVALAAELAGQAALHGAA
jgi:glycosyltransferase involved in cell wall biosynthesis